MNASSAEGIRDDDGGTVGPNPASLANVHVVEVYLTRWKLNQ